jgi:hypothetical protein
MPRTTEASSEVALLPEVPDEQVLEAIRGGDITLEIQDPTQAVLAMVDRIVGAKDGDEVLAKSDTIPAKELDGVALELHSIRWIPSKYALGAEDDDTGLKPKVFALIDATRLDTGVKVLVTCGSIMVMAQLYKLRQLGILDQTKAKIVVKPETANHYRPMNLEPA